MINENVEETFEEEDPLGVYLKSVHITLKKTMMVPLIHERKKLGVVLLANKFDKNIFTHDDVQFMVMIKPILT